MPEPLTVEQAKYFLGLFRSGKLYEIEKWIASCQSLRLPPQFKKSPLQVAVATRFLDAHLGRLAQYLRLLGFDALYDRDSEDGTALPLQNQSPVVEFRDSELKNRTFR